MKTDNYLALCLEQASKSSMYHSHGAIVVVRGGKVIGQGFNEARSGFDGGALKTGSIAGGPLKLKGTTEGRLLDILDGDFDTTKGVSHKSHFPFENVGGGLRRLKKRTLNNRVYLNEKPYYGTEASKFLRKPLSTKLLPLQSNSIKSVARQRSRSGIWKSNTKDEELKGKDKDHAINVRFPPLKSVEKDRASSQKNHHHHHSASHHRHHHQHYHQKGQQQQWQRQQQEQHQHKRKNRHLAQDSHPELHRQHVAKLKSKSSTKSTQSADLQPRPAFQLHSHATQQKSGVRERMKSSRLGGADLYVARLGGVHGKLKDQPERPQSVGHLHPDVPTSVNRTVKGGSKPLTGSLHDELRLPERPAIPAVSLKGSELLDRRAIRASQPCYRCVEFMHSVGIKRVFWTNESGDWEGSKVRDLYDRFFHRAGDAGKAEEGVFMTKHDVLRFRKRSGC